MNLDFTITNRVALKRIIEDHPVEGPLKILGSRATYWHHREVEAATRWAIPRILSPKQIRMAMIRVIINNTGRTTSGNCRHEGLKLVRWKRKTEERISFRIRISLHRRDRGLMAGTILHEIEHARQWLSGDLITHTGRKIWKGTSYPLDYPYLERPWEIAARAATDRWAQDYVNEQRAARERATQEVLRA